MGSFAGNEISFGSLRFFSITVHLARYGDPEISFTLFVRSDHASLSSRSAFGSVGVAFVLCSDVGALGSISVRSRNTLGSRSPTWL